MQSETDIDSQMSKDTTNLEKLRDLVDVLETQNQTEPPYTQTISQIEQVVKAEIKIIKNLKRNDTKIKHYETICNSVLALISATT